MGLALRISREKPVDDLVLVMCPIWHVDEPPLGLAYLAEHLSSVGWQVRVMDMNLDSYLSNPDRQRLWPSARMYDLSLLDPFKDDIRKAAQRAADSGARVVGFSVNQKNLSVSIAVARLIKKLNGDAVVVFGGPDCFLYPDRDSIPQDALDYFVVGDGEQIMDRFLSALARGQEPGEVDGVIPSGQNRELEYNSRNSPSQKDVPFPTFKHFTIEAYQGNSVPLIFTRGCTRRCVFCNDQSYFRPFSVSEPREAADKLQFYVEKLRMNTFSFHDQAINGNPKALTALLEEIVRRQMDIHWSSNIMVRRGMDKSFFELLKAAGCRNLFFGVESFSDMVLAQMNKGFTVEDARQALTSCNEAGIGVMINLIVGFPGEEEAEIQETMQFLRENRDSIDKVLNLSTCFVAPRSVLERRPKDFGIVLPRGHFANWRTQDGRSTNETRTALAVRMRAYLGTLGIACETVNTLKDINLKRYPIS